MRNWLKQHEYGWLQFDSDIENPQNILLTAEYSKGKSGLKESKKAQELKQN